MYINLAVCTEKVHEAVQVKLGLLEARNYIQTPYDQPALHEDFVDVDKGEFYELSQRFRN